MDTDPLHYFAGEWQRLQGGAGLAAATVLWSSIAPALPPLSELDAAFATARAERDHTRSDSLLHALLRAAAVGGAGSRVAAVAAAAQLEPAAGRIVGDVRSALVRANRRVPLADVRATVAGVLWETVRCYPLHRTRAVAANVAGDMLNASLRAFDCHVRCRGRAVATDPEILAELLADQGPATGSPENASEELVALLSWALVERHVNREQTDLLLRRWASASTPVPAQVIADELGWTRRTAHRRCQDAVTALHDAVAATSTPVPVAA